MSEPADLPDLASERLGGAVLAASDEFFAPKEALLRPHPAEWREGEFTERGKWMDGWETRRHAPAPDWCIVRLGVPGMVRQVEVDTTHFRGNFPEACSIEGCEVGGTPSVEELAGPSATWTELIPRTPLLGDARNLLPVRAGIRVTHLRLTIHPDGGVARLRVRGVPDPAWTRAALAGGEVDLAALENGGWVIACSDMFFGDRQNLILPGRSTHMADGWETRRRRDGGHDWSIVRLGRRGTLHRVELDTDHFRGNAPERALLEGIDAGEGGDAAALARDASWRPLLPDTPLHPHARHRWEELDSIGPVSHVRLSIHPCGGVARMRLFGVFAAGPR
jgi:allantoicase